MKAFYRKYVFILTAVVLFSLTFPFIAGGMSAYQHFEIWNISFGLADEKASLHFRKFWSFLQVEVIDKEQPGGDLSFYNELKYKFPGFNWGVYGHRLLFHWGFNADPSKHLPLVRRVNGTVPENKRNLFYASVIEEQKKRNGQIIAMLEGVLGISGDIPRAIATIAYDVHILCDYSTQDIQALPEIRYIANDFVRLGLMRLPGGSKYRDIVEAAFYVGETRKERALNALMTIAVYLPRIVSPVFHRLGIGCIVPNSLQDESIVKEKVKVIFSKGGY